MNAANRPRVNKRESASSKLFSVIIPTRNEERNLSLCIKSLRNAAEYAHVSIEPIVVINRCTDRSEHVAIELGCLVIKNEERNLSRIRNAGIYEASGEVIVTLDADSIVARNFFLKICECLGSGRYIGGGVLIIPERWSLGILTTALALAPFFLAWGISGGALFAKKEDWLAIEGFDPDRYSAEDVDLAKRLKRLGKSRGLKFKNLLRTHIITSCRKFDRFGDWYMLKQPLTMFRLLRGQKSEEADRLWYDF